MRVIFWVSAIKSIQIDTSRLVLAKSVYYRDKLVILLQVLQVS